MKKLLCVFFALCSCGNAFGVTECAGTVNHVNISREIIMRHLTPQEKYVINQFAKRLPERQRYRLLRDLDGCKVEEKGENASRLVFNLRGYTRPPYKGQHAYPVEGMVYDNDGSDISVYLYADENDRLLELEFVKWADDAIRGVRWDSFKLID